MQDVVIVGAGAMGCLFAARLAEAGAGITVVDVDRARLDAIARDGITVRDDGGERTVQVAAKLAADVRDTPDLVILFTKGVHSRAAIGSVAHLAGPDTHALTLQNGIGNAEIMAEVFAPDRILLGVTDLPSDLEGATRVASHGHGSVTLGGFTPTAHPKAEVVAELLNGAGLSARVDPDITVAVWEKVAFNAALNALGAVIRQPNGAIDCPEGRRIAFAIVAETLATAEAKGVAVDRARVEAKVGYALANHRGHKASMLQDLLAGRATEIETINGAIVSAARQAGVDAPVTATLADLVRLIERNRER